MVSRLRGTNLLPGNITGHTRTRNTAQRHRTGSTQKSWKPGWTESLLMMRTLCKNSLLYDVAHATLIRRTHCHSHRRIKIEEMRLTSQTYYYNNATF